MNFAKPGRHWLPLIFYFLFFGVTFLQFPLQNAFPFTCDGFMAIAMAKTLMAKLLNANAHAFFHPVQNIFAYGEFSLAGSLFYNLTRILIHAPIWNYYVFIVSIYALNGWGVYLLGQALTKNKYAALFAGFAFSCSNFMFANNDDSIVFFYLLPCLSLFYLRAFLLTGKNSFRNYFALLGGLQIFFSVQVFVYQLLLHALYGIWHYRLIVQKKLLRSTWLGLGLYGLCALPVFGFYVYSVWQMHPVNAWGNTIYHLNLSDLFRPLPGTLLHGALKLKEPLVQNWLTIKQHAYVGILLMGLGIAGLFNRNRHAKFLGIVALLGLVFALGTQISLGNFEITSPKILFFKLIPLSNYLRINLRAYFLTTLALSLLSAFAIKYLLTKLNPGRNSTVSLGVILFLMGIHFMENMSFPLNGFEYTPNPKLPDSYIDFSKNHPRAVILDLPSNSLDWPEYRQDAIYMYYQTQHGRSIAGGVSGYYPISRLWLQKQINRLPRADAFSELKKIGITHIVFHKKVRFPARPQGIGLITPHISFITYNLLQEWNRLKLENTLSPYFVPEETDHFYQHYDWIHTTPDLKKLSDDSELLILELR